MYKACMRKASFLVALMMLLTTVLAVPVFAAQSRANSIIPELTFSGTTATCNVSIVGEYTDDEISADIKLTRNGRTQATWTAEGEGYIFFSETKSYLTRGYTYVLTVTVTINGVTYSPVSVSATCV